MSRLDPSSRRTSGSSDGHVLPFATPLATPCLPVAGTCVRERQPCIYILASRRHGTISIGVTSDLLRRLAQHRGGLIPGSTRDYGVTRLVHFEVFETMDAAILRERQRKEWRRTWKTDPIEQQNERWEDLAIGLGFAPLPPRIAAHGSRRPPG